MSRRPLNVNVSALNAALGLGGGGEPPTPSTFIPADENISALNSSLTSSSPSLPSINESLLAEFLSPSTQLAKLQPFQPYCTHYDGNIRCSNRANFWFVNPEGNLNPGGPVCTQHALQCVIEYRDKLNEHWKLEPVRLDPISKFGQSRWDLIRLVLGFKVNIVAGLHIYDQAYFAPAKGKYAVGPEDADRGIQWLVESGYLKPIRFNPLPDRKPWIGISYNQQHIQSLYSAKSPTAGHYVDWDYEVVIDPGLTWRGDPVKVVDTETTNTSTRVDTDSTKRELAELIAECYASGDTDTANYLLDQLDQLDQL